MDYKELIEQLRSVALRKNNCYGCRYCKDAADAIETLLEERKAAVNALREAADCTTCKFYEGDHPECGNCRPFLLEEWQWRGLHP